MAARKRPAAAVLGAGHATTTQGSPTRCKRSRINNIRSSADYEEQTCLGEGGFGCVLRARHRATGKIVAIKYLNWEDGSTEAPDPAELLREAGFLEACDGNPYVVGFEGLVRDPDNGAFGLVMEYVAAPSLHKFLRNRRSGQPLPESTVRAIMWKLLTGARTMHDRHVVHRDIKPANLLINKAGQVKIADFGIAEVVSRAGKYRAAYEGTAAYMSPERFDTERSLHVAGDEEGPVDPYAADVWGLGVTVLELLIGRYPLLPAGQELSWAALMCAICFGDLPALPDGAASPELRSFVSACLQKDHRRRPSAAELLAHPFVAGRDVAASRRALREAIEQRCR